MRVEGLGFRCWHLVGSAPLLGGCSPLASLLLPELLLPELKQLLVQGSGFRVLGCRV